jgi:hypothetical protein
MDLCPFSMTGSADTPGLLQTSLDLNATSGQSFRYSLELTGQEAVEAALRFLAVSPEPGSHFRICLRRAGGTDRKSVV